MSVLRAKTLDLIETRPLTEKRKKNSELNRNEAVELKEKVESYPRRLVFELTNACNLNCVMCGRNSAEFKPTVFKFEWTNYFKDIIDKVEEVTLMGWGEPTIHPEFRKFLYWAYENGLRKYFCTNGMKLDELTDDIFKTETDVIGISLDGAEKETNNRIRRGSDFDKIIKSIKNIARIKKERNINYPYMNFVLTAMKSNFHEIPDMIRLAKDAGVQEVKVVYLTVFEKGLIDQSLFNCIDEVRKVFSESEKLADELGIKLKLPYIQGEDIAAEKEHKECFTCWRDFFLGSDGYVRSCMSTPVKLFDIRKYKTFDEMWNSVQYKNFRKNVNSGNMDISCKKCYQSSFANWNKKETFIQIGNDFSPKWKDEK